MDDKRRYQRLRFGFLVIEPHGQRQWMTENISLGGCFLETVEKLSVGAKIRLIFQLPDSTRYIEALGEVKHFRKEGMGIEFVDMKNEGKEDIERFIRDFIQYQNED